MTVVTEAPSVIGTKIFDTVSRCIEEAQSGPMYSGLSETININGVRLDLAASRDWGVRFTRKLVDGSTETRHLSGADLTLDAAAAAFAELLSL